MNENEQNERTLPKPNSDIEHGIIIAITQSNALPVVHATHS